jgi:hypothetical protein
MLSIDKVTIYRRFNGDSDGFYRSGGKDGDGIDHEDWVRTTRCLTGRCT